ncbi:hypothetical protein VTO42DRAFT_5272 [Malbranchea cinnamomea]
MARNQTRKAQDIMQRRSPRSATYCTPVAQAISPAVFRDTTRPAATGPKHTPAVEMDLPALNKSQPRFSHGPKTRQNRQNDVEIKLKGSKSKDFHVAISALRSLWVMEKIELYEHRLAERIRAVLLSIIIRSGVAVSARGEAAQDKSSPQGPPFSSPVPRLKGFGLDLSYVFVVSPVIWCCVAFFHEDLNNSRGRCVTLNVGRPVEEGRHTRALGSGKLEAVLFKSPHGIGDGSASDFFGNDNNFRTAQPPQLNSA